MKALLERFPRLEPFVEWKAVRASGPGGQNVNKVSSKVELRLAADGINLFDSLTRSRLRTLAGRRLIADGTIVIVSQKTRDQSRNLEDAAERLVAMIEEALTHPTVRRPTKPSRGSVRRRLEAKRQTSEKKQNRHWSDD